MDVLLYILGVAFALCAGILIGHFTIKFDGLFIVNDLDESSRWILDVNIDPKDIPNKKEIRLKVRKMTEGDV